MNPVLEVARDLGEQIRPAAFGPDRSEAERFLRALVGSSDAPVTFQTFTDVEEWRDKKIDKDGNPWPLDSEGRPRDPLAAWRHGTLAQYWSWLARQNKNGAGVFMMVNGGNGRGRNEAAIRDGGGLRAVFADDDTGELTPQALEVTPTIIIRSRHGLHAYWCLRPGEPIAAFGPAQTALAAKLGTDPSVNDLPRVMRLPGFVHLKSLEDPFVVHVVQTNESRFTVAEVLDGFGIAAGVDAVHRPREATAYTNGAADEALDTAALERARHFLSGQPQAVQDDLGDKLTYRIIAHLVRDLAVPPRMAMVALLEWDARNSPPWGEAGLREKIAHVLKYGKHELGTALPAAKQWEDPGPLFVPVADFLASCGERVEYDLEPYLPKRGLLIVGGPTKHGKTWFVSYLAGEIAATGAVVMFVEEEGPKETLRARLEPFLRPDAKIHVAHRKGFKLDDERLLRALIEEVKAAGAQVLVLDPLNQLHKHLRQIGDVPAEAIQAIQRIIRETGCSVILVHHNRKGASWDKDSDGEGQSADLAGSYAWSASADNIIQIKAVPNKERRHGEIRFFVENTDNRNCEPFPRRLAVVRPGPRSADSITFAEPDCPALKILREILPFIPENSSDAISVENIRKAAGKGKAVVQSGVDFGVRTGMLDRRLKGGGIYRVKNVGPSGVSPMQSDGLRTSDSPYIGESGVRPRLDGHKDEANAG